MLEHGKGWRMWGVAAIALGLVIAAAAGPSTVQAAPASATYPSSTAITQVDVSGANGGALIWPLFTVNNTNTLLAITNTSIRILGVDEVAGGCAGSNCPSLTSLTPHSDGMFTLVRFHFRRDTDSLDLKDFSVCLSPGDVWTATLTRVGSQTKLISTDLSTINNESSPVTGINEAIVGNPLVGYIEAVAVDNGTSKELGCAGQPGGIPSCPNCTPFAMVRSLMGEVFYVSLGTGLASGANATSIGAFQVIESPSTSPVVDTIRSVVFPFGTAAPLAANNAKNRVFFALTHPGEHVTVGSLKSRWILDTTGGFDTQLVVTFPLGNVTLRPNRDFGFTGSDVSSDRIDFNFNIPSTLALYLRDDEEHRSNSPRQVVMGKEVNIITLSTEVAASPSLVPAGATGGWLHLLNDLDENEFTDAVAGRLCTVNTSTDTCISGAGTLNNFFVPAMLPVVGFTTLTGTVSGSKLSALLPWKWNSPAVLYSCPQATGNEDVVSGGCRGRAMSPHANE